MRITVRVIPRSSKNIVEWERESGMLKVRLTVPLDDASLLVLLTTFSPVLQQPEPGFLVGVEANS